MKFAAIGFVVLILAAAFYITDRSASQRKTLHLADSLDSINNHTLHYFVDSSSRLHDQNYNQRLIQLKRHIDFQDRVISHLTSRLDSLIHAEHGRESN